MTASFTFDVIFVGAGHNALIAASYLAKEGRGPRLLAVERDQLPSGRICSAGQRSGQS
jgi:phytoene dehydrogenase-like protein